MFFKWSGYISYTNFQLKNMITFIIKLSQVFSFLMCTVKICPYSLTVGIVFFLITRSDASQRQLPLEFVPIENYNFLIEV